MMRRGQSLLPIDAFHADQRVFDLFICITKPPCDTGA